jgi:hypothetical protein
VGLRGFKPRCSWRCVRVTAARRERGSGSGRASRLRQARRVRRQREGSSAQRSATSTPITDVTAEVRVRAFERPPGPNRRLRVCRARDRQSGRVCARPIAVRCCAKRRAALAVRLTMISDAIRSLLPMWRARLYSALRLESPRGLAAKPTTNLYSVRAVPRARRARLRSALGLRPPPSQRPERQMEATGPSLRSWRPRPRSPTLAKPDGWPARKAARNAAQPASEAHSRR